MKQKFLFLICMGLSLTGWGQLVVDGVNLNEDKAVEFINVVALPTKGMKPKLIVSVDYGQKTLDKPGQVDDGGQPLEYTSLGYMLNFFYAKGWDFEAAIPAPGGLIVAGGQLLIFRKRK